MAEFFRPVHFYRCGCCGHEWQARGSTPPAQCRRCHARDWNSPFRKPKIAKPLKPIAPFLVRARVL
jgi:hypothetical protein